MDVFKLRVFDEFEINVMRLLAGQDATGSNIV